MALSIQSPCHSFIQFNETGVIDHCIFDFLQFCLPVYDDRDISFQFFVNGTETEIDALCGVYGTQVQVGIVDQCDDENFLLDFTGSPYNDEAELFRLSATQILVNWSHGVPGFTAVRTVGQCFRIRVQIGDQKFCSNCLQRTADNCFTSVLEYGNDENSFGFNYCNSGAVSEESISCAPTIIQFTNTSTLTIPYTQSLRDSYGDAPSVQIWVSDGTSLVNMGITATFDTFPVNTISVDLGGPGSGIVVIR